MNSITLFLLFIVLVLLNCSVCRKTDLDAEVKKTLSIEGIKEATENEKRLAKRIVEINAKRNSARTKLNVALNEIQGLKDENEFQSRVSAAFLDRDILTKYQQQYLSSWFRYSLKFREHVDKAYGDFFNSTVTKPRRIENEAFEFQMFLWRNHISVQKFIEEQSKTYSQLSAFINDFARYCKNNLRFSHCQMLFYMPPRVNEEFKQILTFMEKRILSIV